MSSVTMSTASTNFVLGAKSSCRVPTVSARSVMGGPFLLGVVVRGCGIRLPAAPLGHDACDPGRILGAGPGRLVGRCARWVGQRWLHRAVVALAQPINGAEPLQGK